MRVRFKARVRVARALWRAGIVRPRRPDTVVRSLAMLHRWGLSPAVAYALTALHQPQRIAVIDDRGALSFAEMHRRTNALARGLRESGVREGDTVAIMCRNHRGFIEATVACSKLGARVLYLDTALDASEATGAIVREDALALIYDEEFSVLVKDTGAGRMRFIAASDEADRPRPFLLEELIARAGESELTPPSRRPSTVSIAAGAGEVASRISRRIPNSLVLPTPLLAALPLRPAETTVLAAPLCHAWGFVHMQLGLRLGSTLVLRAEFDPEQVLCDVARHRAAAMAVLPEMLQQITALPRATLARYETSSLRVIAVYGATLPGELAMPAIDRFGVVLYNLRGPSVVRLDDYWARRCYPAGGVHATPSRNG